MSNREALIEAQDVSKNFGGVHALDRATISFFPHEVHCIAGENGCGKSTLIKIISGAYRPSSGTVVVDGVARDHLTPRHAFELGIDVIYQDFSLMPNLTAAENIALPGSLASGRSLRHRRAERELAEKAVAALGVNLELNTPVGDLTVAERQLCAIARALAHEARFIAMDEPTSALTWREVDALFEAVRKLRDDGVSIVFISHKMQEVFDIADRVTVMRNGRMVAAGTPEDFTHASLNENMTGRRSGEEIPSRGGRVLPDPALEVRDLSLHPLFEDISFTVYAGEVVGMAGLLGSGRTEIAEAITGVRRAESGEIRVDDKPIAIRHMADAVAAGIAYVPEDRVTQGLFMDQPIGDNIVAAHIRRFARRLGILSRPAADRAERDAVRDLRIKIGSLREPVRTLSGGNAQRVLLAKWLLGNPKLLVLNGPTVGVDVGSKFDIMGLLKSKSLQGLGVLIISDDIPELVAMCDRVLVVRSGRLTAEIDNQDLTEANILAAVAS